MVNLLIPYVRLPNHPDPLLDEFTYGDVDVRANKLKNDLKKGDYVFFHTTTRGRHFITAYYVVERVLDTIEAAKDKLMVAKYKNPHISEFVRGERPGNDALLFGDPILSRKLPRPLPFNRNLAERLSLRIPFAHERSELSCIASATRQWRELTQEDINILLEEIEKIEASPAVSEALLSTDEVEELREIDLEELIAKNPDILEKELTLVARQYEVTATERIDLLFKDKKGDYVVVELKLESVGRGTLTQIKRYMHEIRKTTKKDVRGMIVCKDILRAFKETYKKLHDVKVYYYGWRVGLTPASFD